MAPKPTPPALTALNTCSYKEFPDAHPDGPIPVQFSNGVPRTLRYKVGQYAVPGGFPLRETFNLSKAEFATRYVQRVRDNRLQIEQEIDAVRKAAQVGPDHPLVLLCFEWPLGKAQPGGEPKWCHRTLFAALWTQLTGQEVRELGGVVMPETSAAEKELDSLF